MKHGKLIRRVRLRDRNGRCLVGPLFEAISFLLRWWLIFLPVLLFGQPFLCTSEMEQCRIRSSCCVTAADPIEFLLC